MKKSTDNKQEEQTKLKVKRTGISNYFTQAFAQMEASKINTIAHYLLPDSKEIPEILITNTHTKFSDYSEDFFNHLKLIIHPNSGYDNFPESLVKTLKAPIVIGNPIRAQAVTQYIISSIFKHFETIPHTTTWEKSRKWERKLLSEMEVAIIGYGHIGRLLNSSLRALVKKIHVYDPYENLNQPIYKKADIIILASSYNKHNYHLIDSAFLKEVSSDVMIVNTSRGELIATEALIDFLDKNPKAYAVLDVFEKEPNDFKEFSHLKNIALSSHIAGVYSSIHEATIEYEYQTIKDFVEISPTDFQVKYQKMILQNKLKENLGLI